FQSGAIGQVQQQVTQGVVEAILEAEVETVTRVAKQAREEGRAEGRMQVDPTAIAPVTQTVDQPTQPVQSSRDIYEGARTYLMSDDRNPTLSLANLRRDLATRAQGRLQEMTWGEQLEWTPHGWKDESGKFASAARVAAFMN